MSGFALRLAWREARSSGRRIGLYMGAIALGVAALVAINSFRHNVVESVRAEARTLLGADLRLHSNAPFAGPVDAALDSAQTAGVLVSRVTQLGSMVLAPESGRTRLFQVTAIDGGYPFYGEPVTEPAGRWPFEPEARAALVDPAVLVQLDARAGDTLAIGQARFIIAGTVEGVGGEVGFQSAVGPRVYIPAVFLAETELIGVGSLVRYQAYLRFDDEASLRAFLDVNEAVFDDASIGRRTAEEQAESLTDALGTLGRYLGMIGLVAMLLGGVGVASAVHVFVREKLTAVAVLRCLGASQRQVFAAYLLQTGALGLGGAALGAAAGVGVQTLLPRVLGPFLPVDVVAAVHGPTVLAGLAIGAWVALAFALLPLLAVRDVAPLQALRRDAEPTRARRTLARPLTLASLGATVVVLGVWQAPSWAAGMAFATSIGTILGMLGLAALLAVRATRRFVPRRAAYVVRQGVSNLHRPNNQTVAVTLALGFGVFLLSTLYLVQVNLLDAFRLEAGEERPNVLLFDIQPDQTDGLSALASERGTALRDLTPIVPARIAAINGRTASELMADTTDASPSRWTLRREYRNTYRAEVAETERVVAGEWWGGESALPRISLEADLADDLRVGIGDRITWDVQGVPIETTVANLREVDWMRFAPNFFVVFEPGVLEAAPHSLIALARVPDARARAELQRDIVEGFPNISALDLAVVQEAVDNVLGQVTLAIRFLALFSIAGGLVVLVGAVSTSRVQRAREAALLRTLGATGQQIRRILLTEYAALGALAGLVGTALAAVGGWALMTWLFELEFQAPVATLLIAWAATVALTTGVGVLNGRGVLRKAPLGALREVGG